jgi:phosphate transport system protein
MERHIEESLSRFNTDLLKMAALTEQSIHRSVEALKHQDKKIALTVIEDDQVIDDYENKLVEESILLFALHQPMAVDLRLITAGMRISTDLERIADLTVNISQRVLETADQSNLKVFDDIAKLSDHAKKMLKAAIDSFVKRDAELAKKVILSDKEANQLRNKIIKELVDEHIKQDPQVVHQGIALLLVARDLERICDHTTNIAEDVIYLIRAKIIKHHLDELYQEDRESPTT